MRYLIDLSSIHNDKIQDLINTGKYQSIASFIQSAVENQLYLESSPSGAIENKLGIEQKNDVASTIATADLGNKDFLHLLSRDIVNIETCVPPEDSKITPPPLANESDSNLWIWGQINRIFPLKVGLRVLGNMLKQSCTKRVDLNEFKETAAKIARSVGLKLMDIEEVKGIKRENRISAGLPIGEPAFNSESRYKAHFLVSARKDGILDGALAKLKFINIEIDKKETIGITSGGLAFTTISNPILDAQEYNFSLSDAEIDCYLKHIASQVPGEYRAIKWMFSIIKKGIDRREDINSEVAKKYPEWTEAIVNTQRAGLISRMFELRLLERDKKGIEVIYKISSRGEDL